LDTFFLANPLAQYWRN